MLMGFISAILVIWLGFCWLVCIAILGYVLRSIHRTSAFLLLGGVILISWFKYFESTVGSLML